MTPLLLAPPLRNTVQPYDWRDLMSCLPANSVDAIVSDPPYNTTDLVWETVIDWRLFWIHARRILKDRRCPTILFSAQPFTTDLIVSNRKGFRYELIWHKANATGFLHANHRPLRDHENVLIFADGMPDYTPQREMTGNKPKTKKRAHADHYSKRGHENSTWGNAMYPRSVWAFKHDNMGGDTSNGAVSLHPSQKPLSLMKKLLLTYTTQGDVILDPFAGSGSTLVAAQELGRQFIGGDLSEQYCEVARKRLAMPFTKPMFA